MKIKQSEAEIKTTNFKKKWQKLSWWSTVYCLLDGTNFTDYWFLRQKPVHFNAEKYNNKINGVLASLWKLHIADVLLRHICQIVNHIPIVADIHSTVFENHRKVSFNIASEVCSQTVLPDRSIWTRISGKCKNWNT